MLVFLETEGAQAGNWVTVTRTVGLVYQHSYSLHEASVSKSNQIWDLAVEWVSKKIRSPFSNYVTKSLLIIGASIIAAPLFGHLILNALLKHVFDIDLGIEPPGTMTYIASLCFMLLAVVNNTIHNYFTLSHQARINEAKVSIYKETWGKLDAVFDDTARLSNLYATHYLPRDDELVLKAEESIVSCTDWLRKNRPFYYSESLYEKCSEICSQAIQETLAFRDCIRAKKKEEATIGKNASLTKQIEFYNKVYSYEKSQKEAVRNLRVMRGQYDAVCAELRKELG